MLQRHGRALLLALLFTTAAVAHAQAPAAAPSLESFFSNPTFGGAVLSPNGKYLAVRAGGPGKHDFLVTIDLQTNAPTVVGAFDDADIDQFRWVSDERLVFNVRDKDVGQGDVRHGPGLFAVDRDGSKLLQLADRDGYRSSTGSKITAKLLSWNTHLLGQRGAQDSEYIYVVTNEYNTKRELHNVALLRLNTLTGQSQVVPRPAPVQHWMLDNKGEPRLAIGTDKTLTTIYYREPANGEWRTLASYNPYVESPDTITPQGFAPDGRLYVVARGNADTTSVHTFNLATGKVDPDPVIVTTGYDFNGSLVTTRDKLLGLHLTTDAESDEWIDPGMKAVQASVDKLLPTTVNLLSVPSHPDSPWVLVRGYSDVVPSSWWLYNNETRQLNKVGESHPGIKPAQMGRQQFVRYKARDGLEIPALLTVPPGPQRTGLPMVVLVHGGPWVRGASWGWDRESQFLASRGYVVLEPLFRGTTGFGARHFMAGWKQWGLAMQNDVADGARWVIAKGIADPKRICIAGASYGGYATLMGLVNDPDLFKCGVNWVGVTDINLMYSGGWNYESDMSDEWKRYGMPEMIGDQVKDAAQLKATSPIEQAARITQPLLLAYGGVDRRVPMYHGKKFHDAVTRTNKNVEWIEYPEEGHGWHLPKNNYDFWGRVEAFLDKNIGKGAVKE